ncbi:MAG: 4-(cytidine 5'-diphospho)-2-C-methyl-D-erythritol kinase [Methylomonas sp.]
MTESMLQPFGWGDKWPAPAKLNLMLRITGRRPDGYHLLQTVFQMTDLCDWITFHADTDDRVSLQTPLPGVPEQSDLTVRAARLLKEHTGSRQGVSIAVEKNLPLGGGLGGGSSDAATTLVALNRLWRLELQRDELIKLGLQLGADVPVFVFGHSAWAEGVGEKLQAVTVPEQWLIIIKPDVHVNTGEIFSAEGLTRNSKPIKMADFLEGDDRNDCLDVVCKLYPQVNAAMKDLSEFSEAKLTGTGACVFARFAEKQDAQTAYAALVKKWTVYLAKGINKSPLYKMLEQGTG